MTRILFIIIANLIALGYAKANDGVFRINGNELVPIHNTDIKVSKEILSIKKISEKQVAVSVYYEFDNPGEGQLINVGFEARPPQEEEEPLADDTFKITFEVSFFGRLWNRYNALSMGPFQADSRQYNP